MDFQSNNHRMIHAGREPRRPLVQSATQSSWAQLWGQPRSLRALSSWVSQISRGGICTTSLRNLFGCTIAFMVQFFVLLKSSLNLSFQLMLFMNYSRQVWKDLFKGS